LWSDRRRALAEGPKLHPSQATGRLGEDLAHRYLEDLGYQVVARNWTMPARHCEVDLVARDGPETVFVEVKTRRSSAYGDPERNIDRVKHLAMRRAAYWYMKYNGRPGEEVRFDLVTVLLGTPPSIGHQRGYAAWGGRDRQR
jgi:putative endonuclease